MSCGADQCLGVGEPTSRLLSGKRLERPLRRASPFVPSSVAQVRLSTGRRGPEQRSESRGCGKELSAGIRIGPGRGDAQGHHGSLAQSRNARRFP